MQLTRDARPDANFITGLDHHGLRIRERVYSDSLIVSADTLIEGWPVRDSSSLQAMHWRDVISLEPQIVLFGSGNRQVFPASRSLAPLLTRGVGVEVMDTPAACRTFNLLLSEGRRVVAALILDNDNAR